MFARALAECCTKVFICTALVVLLLSIVIGVAHRCVLCCFTMACFSLYLMQSFLYHFVKKLLSAARELPPALDSAPWVNVFDFLRILKVSVRLQRALLYR